jgi:hypothetical protein
MEGVWTYEADERDETDGAWLTGRSPGSRIW